ncbi:MAG: hypothetical protein ABEH59_12000 [Halobacteriales archaeon]
MHRSTLTKLALGVFGLVFLSFLIRGFGQFIIGSRTATVLAGPVAVAAGGLLLVVIGLWGLGRVGVVRIESDDRAP